MKEVQSSAGSRVVACPDSDERFVCVTLNTITSTPLNKLLYLDALVRDLLC